MKKQFISIHVIQTLPPSNPNRDKAGNLKSIPFGGTVRQRLSSQAQKRAARQWFRANEPVSREQTAERSRHWDIELAEHIGGDALASDKRLAARFVLGLFNNGPESAFKTMMDAEYLEEANKGKRKIDPEKGITKNMLFLSHEEVQRLAEIANAHSDFLFDVVRRFHDFVADTDNAPPKKSEAKKLVKALEQFNKTVCGEVALFGRMMAQLSAASVDGSVQVADAISINTLPTWEGTNKSKSVDFFSAVDDVIPDDGAGMIGDTPINAPVLYRYANVAVHEAINLMGDTEAAKAAIAGFIKGFALALPTGYQTRFAHDTFPDLIIIESGKAAPKSLAPAFSFPINEPDRLEQSLSEQAAAKLFRYRADVELAYGKSAVGSDVFVAGLPSHGGEMSLDEALESVLSLGCFET